MKPMRAGSVMRENQPELLARQGLVGGGDERIRTADLLSAIQALSQLSYVPTLATHINGGAPPHSKRRS
jgi:hypothetical protein